MSTLIEEQEHASKVRGIVGGTIIIVSENHGMHGWVSGYDLTVGNRTYRGETMSGISAILSGKQIVPESVEWRSAFENPADDPFRDCQHRQ